jgi:hypothetical protein
MALPTSYFVPKLSTDTDTAAAQLSTVSGQTALPFSEVRSSHANASQAAAHAVGASPSVASDDRDRTAAWAERHTAAAAAAAPDTNQTTVSPALPTSPLSVRSNVDSESGAYGPDAERSDDGLYSISNPVSQWEGSTAAGSSDLEQTNEYWRSRTIPGGADHWRRRIPPDRQRLAVEPVGYPLASLGPTTSMTDDLDRIRHWSTSGAPIDIARKMWADRWGILQTAGHAAALTAHLSMLYDYLFSSAANEPSRLASILNPWVETTAQACNLESLRFLENSLATFPGGNLGIFAAVTTIPPLVDWALRRMQDQPTECRTAIDDCTCGSSTCPL